MGKSAVKSKSEYHFVVIALIAVFVAAGAVGLAGRSFLAEIRENVRSTTIQVIEELTESKAKILRSIMSETEKDLLILAECVGKLEEDTLKVELVKMFQETHGSEAIALLDNKGRYLYGSEEALSLKGIPEIFAANVVLNSVTMSDAVLGQQGKRQILFGVILPDGGRIYAALSGEALQKAYGEATYGEHGYSYIVEGSGNIILPPVKYSYEQIYGNIENLLKADNNESVSIKAFMEALKDGKAGSVVFLFDGKEQLLCFEPLDVKRDWQIITVVPVSAVEKDGARIVQMSVCMVGIIVAALLLLLFLGFSFYGYTQKKQRDNDKFMRNIYQAISENIDTVIFILDDTSSSLDYVFENSGRLLGIPAEKFMTCNEIPDSPFCHKLVKILQSERPKNWCEQEQHTFNDCLRREMWLKILICPFHLGGRLKYIYAVTDVTIEHIAHENIVAAVAAAEQASAAKSQFLTSMSHDIRTPMNGIVGMTAIAKMNLGNQDKMADCLDKIDMSSKLLLGLINDVLDMSKIESGKMTLTNEPFDIRQLLQGIESIMRPQFNIRKQEFLMDIHIHHSELMGDSVRLSQIFTNLLSNAVKFTPEGGKITLIVKELEQKHSEFASFSFEVKDTGIGMDADFMKSIFKPFERAADASARKIEGTGLGMAITKNLVTAMGGQIFVESEPDVGTSFIVELELALQEPGLVECVEEKDAGGEFDYAEKRFLLAEDNEINREIVVELLGSFQAKVETAEDGKQALELFLSHEPGYYDAILMDIQMPVMNGYEATRAIRASSHPQAKSIPVIAMTADAFAEDVRAAKEAGMNAHITKPINMSVVTEALRNL